MCSHACTKGNEVIEDSEKLLLKDLLRAGEELRRDIDRALCKCDLFPPPLTFRSRVKSEETTCEKVLRKRIQRPQYGVADVRDIVGFRFVTLLKVDIAGVVNDFLTLLRGNHSVSNRGPFEKVKLLEFKHYISSPEFDSNTGGWVDPIDKQLREIYIQHYGKSPHVELEPAFRAQYSGVHIIASFPCRLGDRVLHVPVEFQIRSVFEDAWGEIDHKLFYEADRQGRIEGEQTRLAAAAYLKILKDMLDNAADYAALISTLNFTAPTDRPPNVWKNLDGVEYIREICAPLTSHGELTEPLDELIRLGREKTDLDAAIERGSSALSAYTALADRYGELIRRFPPVDTMANNNGKRYRTVLCLIAMEEALCRLLSGNAAQMSLSIAQYVEIEKNFPDYPTCRFRRAQACAQLLEKPGELEKREDLAKEAIEGYSSARRLLDEIVSHASSHSEYDILVSHGQRSYLDGNIERLWGFVLWRIGDLRRKAGSTLSQRDFDETLRAYQVTSGALDRLAKKFETAKSAEAETNYIALLNSTTYFALETLDFGKQLDVAAGKLPQKAEIQSLLGMLEQECVEKNFNHIPRWETILKGQTWVGDESGKLRAAKKICEIYALPHNGHLGDYERDVHERAYREAWPIVLKALSEGHT